MIARNVNHTTVTFSFHTGMVLSQDHGGLGPLSPDIDHKGTSFRGNKENFTAGGINAYIPLS